MTPKELAIIKQALRIMKRASKKLGAPCGEYAANCAVCQYKRATEELESIVFYES